MKEYKSVCPYDCPDACGLIVSVENNKVVSVRGNKDHAFTRGTLCPKMVHYEKVIHSPLRLEYPMKRIGKKGVGEDQYVRISWDEALDTIVNNFKHTIDTYGSESILRYSYAGTMGVIQSPAADYFFRRIGATDQDRGICSPAKQAGFRSVYGDTLAVKPQEAQYSDLIVLWGINATATDVHILHDVNSLLLDEDQFFGYFYLQMTHRVRLDMTSAFGVNLKHGGYVLYVNPFIMLRQPPDVMKDGIKREYYMLYPLI